MHIPLLVQIVLACLLGGLLSVAAAALVMFGLPRKWLGFTVSFSTGLLLATATLHLLPEALESGLTPHEVFPLLLAGILGFFALEKFALWRHAHQVTNLVDAHAGDHACEDHTHNHHHAHGMPWETLLILVGDGFHNFTDGLLIAAAFLAAAKDLLGPKGWSEDPEKLLAAATPWRGTFQGDTPFLARPASTAEAAALVKLCAAHRLAIGYHRRHRDRVPTE